MRRSLVLISIGLLGFIGYWSLGLELGQILPRGQGFQIARDFLSAAFTPALDYEAEFVPAGSPSFLWVIGNGFQRTVIFAGAALSLALILGLPLAVLASGLVPTSIRIPTRLFIAGMRSVHELLWAVVFLAAFGLNSAGAIIAIAIPYAGTLAKVFSEMLDEAPQRSYQALIGAGASRSQAFFGALLPTAGPDMAAYAFYRFECALRSSAVLGFFGYPTLGYYLRQSFENLHYREVWTCLYAILFAVLILETWSGKLRRRLVA
ncbi:MAG: ABC transporter permease subunit [Planctomycetes bacterium]|nr:ABC transporter permease subunit [Planctomycetota bacterium]